MPLQFREFLITSFKHDIIEHTPACGYIHYNNAQCTIAKAFHVHETSTALNYSPKIALIFTPAAAGMSLTARGTTTKDGT